MVGSCSWFVFTASAQSINFTANPQMAVSVLFPAIVADINCDGRPAVPGTRNDGAGNLFPVSVAEMGFSGAIVPGTWPPPIGGVLFDDARFADFDGDGCVDMVGQSYDTHGDSNATPAVLYFNDGTGRFTPDHAFHDLNITGRGEGLVVADFNNDGFLDIFLPYYTFPCQIQPPCPNAPQAYLFLNDGHGHFREVAKTAGVDFSTAPGLHPEVSQAVDIDNNGLVDLYVGGHILLNKYVDNNGIPHFQDCNCGIPDPNVPSPGRAADEGAKFLDWNNDGLLDLVIHNWDTGPTLYQNIGSATSPSFLALSTTTDGTGHPFFSTGAPNFFANNTPNGVNFHDSFGMNIYDLDNDGLEDIITTGSPSNETPAYPNTFFRNTGNGFERVTNPGQDVYPLSGGGFIGFGDMNLDGKIDVMLFPSRPPDTQAHYYKNISSNSNGFISVEMLGPNGERNQHGRVVKVSPQIPSRVVIYTRVVDGGSGYHSQSQYPILIGTQYAVPHSVVAYYGLPGGGVTAIPSFSINPGQYAQVFAPSAQYPNGNVVIYNQPPPPFPSKAMDWLQPALNLMTD
jgi:hypothetical protein